MNKNNKYCFPLRGSAVLGAAVCIVVAGHAGSAYAAQTGATPPPTSPAGVTNIPTTKPSPASQVSANSVGTAASKAAVFPYHGPEFTKFIKTSYANGPAGTPEFYSWMDHAYRRSTVRFKGRENAPTIAALLTSIRKSYTSEPNPDRRAQIEKQTGAFCYRLLKRTIPKFSLARGFEFYNTVRHGERQCYLQSTLVAGMMQAAGMQAGVVMIARSDEGEESNNGHAVALVKLSNGKDILVDVSDHHTPFVKQERLMAADAATGHYRYVVPQYNPAGGGISGYKTADRTASDLPLGAVCGLPQPYMASQFDFYRGERAIGGFTSFHKTAAGLEQSAKFLNRAIVEDPNNPLAQYVLGIVYFRQGKKADARRQIIEAYHLYDGDGFVPDGSRQALALVGAKAEEVARR